MNKSEIITTLKSLNFPPEDCWLVAGSAMVLHGVKETTRDIDLGCSGRLADKLEADGYPTERTADGKRKIVIGSEIEIFEDWLFDRIDTIAGCSVISLDGLIMMKKSLGREKDYEDIARIRAFMQSKERL